MPSIQHIVLLGAAVGLAGGFVYIKDTLQGKTKPNRVTWLIWSIAPMIAVVAALSDGVQWAVLPVFIAGFVPLLIFISSFVNPKSYWKLEPFDYICGICSILGLILWGLTKEPIIAIIFAIISDAFAGIPTVIKSWKHPETESAITFAAGLFNSLTAFFALKTFGISELAFPIYLVLIDSTLVISAYRKRCRKTLNR
jgi:hypothetical protein